MDAVVVVVMLQTIIIDEMMSTGGTGETDRYRYSSRLVTNQPFNNTTDTKTVS